MAFYAFSSLISASSIDTPQMSPLPEDFNNRVRVIDSDVAAPLSPLGLCLAMCKLTIIVLIKQIQRYNTCSYRYAGGDTLPVQNPWVNANAPPAPSINGVQSCLVLQRLEFEACCGLTQFAHYHSHLAHRGRSPTRRELASCSDRPSRQSSIRAGFTASENG